MSTRNGERTDRTSATGYKVNNAANSAIVDLSAARTNALRFLRSAPSDPLEYVGTMVELIHAIDGALEKLNSIHEWSKR